MHRDQVSVAANVTALTQNLRSECRRSHENTNPNHRGGNCLSHDNALHGAVTSTCGIRGTCDGDALATGAVRGGCNYPARLTGGAACLTIL